MATEVGRPFPEAAAAAAAAAARAGLIPGKMAAAAAWATAGLAPLGERLDRAGLEAVRAPSAPARALFMALGVILESVTL